MFKRPNASQIKDTGMVAAFLLVLAGIFSANPILIKAAAVTLLIDMVWPGLFYPFAIVWFGLSALLGRVMSRVILFILFWSLVFPVGLLRRWLGKDTLMLKAWRHGNGSLFRVRDHTYVSEDLEKPY